MIAKPKPDPESYKLALTMLNITAEETLIVEDTVK
jgi:HAD superfamily hydrolase (TIGR01509 family)